MSQLILCAQRKAQATLSQPAAQGAQSLTLSGASSLFSPGDQLFAQASEQDDVQWLGRVLYADASAMTFSRPLQSALPSGANVWSALHILQMNFKAELGRQSKVEPGLSLQRSLGGDYCTVQTGAPLQTDALELYLPGPQTRQEVLGWIETATAWGLEPFTLIETAQGLLQTLRLSAGALESTLQDGGRYRLRLPVHLMEEGAYQ